MTLTTVAVAIALIVFVIARRLHGEAVPAPKKLFLLPIVVGAIGLQNLSHAKVNTVDIAVIAAGCALSLGLGLLRGRLDKVSVVNGAPYMSWSVASVVVFAVNVLSKLALDAGGVAAGGTAAALSSSILFSLGLTLLGEAAIVWLRAQSLPTENAKVQDAGGQSARGQNAGAQYRGDVQQPGRPTIWPPIR
jgi:hypothetical protein